MDTRLVTFALTTLCAVGCVAPVPAPAPEPDVTCDGPCDLFGDAGSGSECSYDWQCSADDGLTCRPETRGDDGWEERKCLAGGLVEDPCDDEDDCAAGLRCVPAQIHADEYYIDWRGDAVFTLARSGLCRPPTPASGFGCDDDWDCVEGLECDEDAGPDDDYSDEWGRCESGSSLTGWAGA